ncbi:hypothetical protein [Wenyingzhuangia sp. 2_MG-2023]|uniref:hypothetical protein n=1 Tax=Wenyingzhuangia sp. 2_MG-2023 TaxID=3062639 RepID=UPI0026E3E74E|nr:hypothetical protein [Wenyingzhuangia sp. 2_MG-2023]MDO6737687.1 hypothetical protein [Wenyingzhuangia sp. 2_MG-2023]MDO6802526.1 hypothetical protein [Wenyingzhuangia sp. 1_MG-2023]
MLTIQGLNSQNTKITSVVFVAKEIVGESHYGFKYDFNITIEDSENFDIERFCKDNIQSIIKGRVADVAVINSILKDLNNDEYYIDKNPKGLRMGSSTKDFDAVELEVFLKEEKLLKMELLYYSPL